MKVIEDIVQSTRKLHEEKEKLFVNYEYLDTLKKNSVNNFLENIKTKTIADIKKVYEEKLDEFNSSTKIYLDKKYQEK